MDTEWSSSKNLVDEPEPVIELVKQVPLKKEPQKTVVEILKKFDGKAPISVLEEKIGECIYPCLEELIVEEVIRVV